MDSMTFARIDPEHFAMVNLTLDLGVLLDVKALAVLGRLLKAPLFDTERVCHNTAILVRETSFTDARGRKRFEPGVFIEHNHAILFEFTLDIAAQVGDAALQCARLLEETANHEQIALDGAILLRAGLPFGLTNDPAIQAEVVQEARSNTAVRRMAGMGIPGEAILGTPTVISGRVDPRWEDLSDSDRRAIIARLQEVEDA